MKKWFVNSLYGFGEKGIYGFFFALLLCRHLRFVAAASTKRAPTANTLKLNELAGHQ